MTRMKRILATAALTAALGGLSAVPAMADSRVDSQGAAASAGDTYPKTESARDGSWPTAAHITNTEPCISPLTIGWG